MDPAQTSAAASLDVSQWKDFLKKEFKKQKLGRFESFDAKRLEKWIPEAKAFYDSARSREEALVANAVRKMETDQNSLAALVAGGFHGAHLFEAFKRRGYTVLWVTPRFVSAADPIQQHEQYLNVLKNNWEPAPKVLLAPPPSQGGLDPHAQSTR